MYCAFLQVHTALRVKPNQASVQVYYETYTNFFSQEFPDFTKIDHIYLPVHMN